MQHLFAFKCYLDSDSPKTQKQEQINENQKTIRKKG